MILITDDHRRLLHFLQFRDLILELLIHFILCSFIILLSFLFIYFHIFCVFFFFATIFTVCE